MAHIIEEDQTLFVLVETCCRGDIDREKFTIQLKYIRPAVEFAAQSISDRDDDQINDWLAVAPDHTDSFLYGIVDTQSKDIIDKLQEDGYYLVETDETTYCIGVTKELAIQSFVQHYPVSYDSWS